MKTLYYIETIYDLRLIKSSLKYVKVNKGLYYIPCEGLIYFVNVTKPFPPGAAHHISSPYINLLGVQDGIHIYNFLREFKTETSEFIISNSWKIGTKAPNIRFSGINDDSYLWWKD